MLWSPLTPYTILYLDEDTPLRVTSSQTRVVFVRRSKCDKGILIKSFDDHTITGWIDIDKLEFKWL